MCIYPRSIKNKKYEITKKNGGKVPAVNDTRTLYVQIKCENCIECRKQKARDWAVRLQEDIRHNRNGKFITLTYSNESIKKLAEELKEYKGYELDNKIATLGVRRFLERWRKKYKKSIRHWLITELGHKGTENIHIHGIIWTDNSYDEIRAIWNYGYIWPRPKERKKTYVNEKTVNYIIKYVHKVDEKYKYYKSKILTSQGIGAKYIKRGHTEIHSWCYQYTHRDKKGNWTLRVCTVNKKIHIEGDHIGNWIKNKFNINKTDETYLTRNGRKISLPTYYRNKIYNDDEKEELWLQKLDKKEKWIMGEKTTNDREYFNIIKYYRKINWQMGYKGWHKDEERLKWEEKQREIMMSKRTEIQR